MKVRCSSCNERIDALANKCKHCGESVSPLSNEQVRAHSRRIAKIAAAVAAVIFLPVPGYFMVSAVSNWMIMNSDDGAMIQAYLEAASPAARYATICGGIVDETVFTELFPASEHVQSQLVSLHKVAVNADESVARYQAKVVSKDGEVVDREYIVNRNEKCVLWPRTESGWAMQYTLNEMKSGKSGHAVLRCGFEDYYNWGFDERYHTALNCFDSLNYVYVNRDDELKKALATEKQLLHCHLRHEGRNMFTCGNPINRTERYKELMGGLSL